MSIDKLRSVNTKFWDDSFIETILPEHRLLFLYLLTSPHCNIAGMYEITVRKMEFHTGLNKDQIMEGLSVLQARRRAFFSPDHSYVFLYLLNLYHNQQVQS